MTKSSLLSRAGGGGDAGSLLPGVLPPELGARVRVAGQTPSCNTKVRTITITTTTHAVFFKELPVPSVTFS